MNRAPRTRLFQSLHVVSCLADRVVIHLDDLVLDGQQCPLVVVEEDGHVGEMEFSLDLLDLDGLHREVRLEDRGPRSLALHESPQELVAESMSFSRREQPCQHVAVAYFVLRVTQDLEHVEPRSLPLLVVMSEFCRLHQGLDVVVHSSVTSRHLRQHSPLSRSRSLYQRGSASDPRTCRFRRLVTAGRTPAAAPLRLEAALSNGSDHVHRAARLGSGRGARPPARWRSDRR